MRFGTWNVSVYRFGSLMTVTRELARCSLDLVGIQGAMSDKAVLKEQSVIRFLLKRKWKSSIRNRIFVHQKAVSAMKRVEFVSDRMSHIVLRGRWFDIVMRMQKLRIKVVTQRTAFMIN
jgi:hypothetical protein